MIFTIIVLTLTSTSICANTQKAQKKSKKSTLIYKKKAIPELSIQATEITGQPQTILELRNNIEIIHGDTIIKANFAKYKVIENQFEASDHISMKHLKNYYTGDALIINLSSYTGFITHPTYLLRQNGGYGQAQRIDFLPHNKIIVTHGTYSTCKMLNPDWHFSVSTLNIDTLSDIGVMHKPMLYLKNIPIFSIPSLSFPLSNKRKSGTLPPTFSITNKHGVELTMPYYFNIAPNYDLMFYPKYMSKRGLKLGFHTRYLGKTYIGEAKIEGIKDYIIGKHRYLLASIHSHTIVPGLTLTWNLYQISDSRYIQDFSRILTKNKKNFLMRHISLTYDNIYLKLKARVTKYRIFKNIINPTQKPYDKLPQLILKSHSKNIKGFNLKLETEFARFFNTYTQGSNIGEKMINGNRVYVLPSISYLITRSKYFIKPKIALNATAYRIHYVPDILFNLKKNIKKTIPIYSIKLGTSLMRNTILLNNNFLHTMQPRLLYVYTPYKDQTRFPNFDSKPANFNLKNILHVNNFTGHDRIDNDHQITFAVTSKLIKNNNKKKYLHMAFGQRFYLQQSKAIFNKNHIKINNQKIRSDMVLSYYGCVVDKVRIANIIRYDIKSKKLIQSHLKIRWKKNAKTSFGLTFKTNKLHHLPKKINIFGIWPISKHLYGISRLNYSVAKKKLMEHFFGIEYQSHCWILRFITQRASDASSKKHTSFYIQFELHGSSQLNLNPLNKLYKNKPRHQFLYY